VVVVALCNGVLPIEPKQKFYEDHTLKVIEKKRLE
jgi:hypothetical protein